MNKEEYNFKKFQHTIEQNGKYLKQKIYEKILTFEFNKFQIEELNNIFLEDNTNGEIFRNKIIWFLKNCGVEINSKEKKIIKEMKSREIEDLFKNILEE